MAESSDEFVIRYVPDFSAVDAGFAERERRAQQPQTIGGNGNGAPGTPSINQQSTLPPAATVNRQTGGNGALPPTWQAQVNAQMGGQAADPNSGVNQYGQTILDRARLHAQDMASNQRLRDQRGASLSEEISGARQQGLRQYQADVRARDQFMQELGQGIRDRAMGHAADFASNQRLTAQRQQAAEEARIQSIQGTGERARGVAQDLAANERLRIQRIEGTGLRARQYAEDLASNEKLVAAANKEKADAIKQQAAAYRRDYQQTISDLGNASRHDLRRFNAAIAETGAARHPLDFFGPARQREMIQGRMAGLDPLDDEYQALRGRDAALRRRTGLNTEVMGTGMYMNLLFGGMELSHALSAVRTGDLGARLALSPQDALQKQLQGLRGATSGFVGGTASELVNVFGNVFGTPSLAKFEESVQTEAFRGGNLDFTRQTLFENRQSEAVRLAYQTGGTLGRDRQALVSEAALRLRDSTAAAGELTSQLGMPGDMGYFKDLMVRFNPGMREPFQREADADKAASPEMQSLRARRDAILAQQKERTAADRLTLELFDIRQADLKQGNLDALGDIADRLTDAPTREMQRRHRARANAQELRQVNREGDGMLFAMTALRQQQDDRLFERDADRSDNLDVARLMYGNAATRFDMQGYSLDAARQNINQRFGVMVDPTTGKPMQFGNILANDPRFAEMQKSYDLAMQGAQIQENRRQIMLRGQTQSANFQLSRNPVAAQLATLMANRAAAMEGVTNPARIAEINEASAGNLGLIAQARADQRQDVHLGLRAETYGVEQLEARNPMGAQIAGFVAQRRQQEVALRRQGLNAEAEQFRRNSQRLLGVQERDYREGFQFSQLESKLLLPGLFNTRDNEDPQKVLKSFAAGQGALNTPTEAKDPGKSLEELLKEVRDSLPAKIAKEMNALLIR